jgi:hypothetical protein
MCWLDEATNISLIHFSHQVVHILLYLHTHARARAHPHAHTHILSKITSRNDIASVVNEFQS